MKKTTPPPQNGRDEIFYPQAESPKKGQGVSDRLIAAHRFLDKEIDEMDRNFACGISKMIEQWTSLRSQMEKTIRLPPAEYEGEGPGDLAYLRRWYQEEECRRGITLTLPINRTLPIPPLIRIRDPNQGEGSKRKRKKKKKETGVQPNKLDSRQFPSLEPARRTEAGENRRVVPMLPRPEIR